MKETSGTPEPAMRQRSQEDPVLLRSLATQCESFSSIESADLEPLMGRIGAARVVLIGEASHGTSEFYRMRARITQELIAHHHFDFVAIEGDWPDVARIDQYVRHFKTPASQWRAFARFPHWMWRNQEVLEFVEWMRNHNLGAAPKDMAALHGLDLYSLYTSIEAVLDYLDKVDPDAGRAARQRYSCLAPWQDEPAVYGQAAVTGQHASCEPGVTRILTDLLKKRHPYADADADGEKFMDAVQNARLVADAELYYRTMYYGSRASWNLRDTHMFETLQHLLTFHGQASKAIVWAHNSHVGDSSATDMGARGEFNIGNLCRRQFGAASFSIGFGTDHGTVAAASNWDEPMQLKTVRPALAGSYEALFHRTGDPGFVLSLKHASAALTMSLTRQRLERAIGVIYRPETERQSHYFHATLPKQFDEYLWFDATQAVTPLKTRALEGLPDTYPFGI
jgi:protein-L-isoaspartate(D-aspartate) O-methyltransferase